MGNFGDAVKDFALNIVAFVIMIILAIISFFFTVYVVNVGATLAGKAADGNFAVLAASILTASAILAGGQMSPIGFLGRPMEPHRHDEDA